MGEDNNKDNLYPMWVSSHAAGGEREELYSSTIVA